MGEGNHLTTTGAVGQAKGRWMWLFGGTAVALMAGGLLMQYLRVTPTKAAADTPAGTARVGGGPKKETLAKVAGESITYDAVAEECVKRHGREVLDDLIHRMIIQKACEDKKISVTQQEISEEIGRIAKRFNLDVSQWLQMLQAERNISPQQYRDSVIYPMIALKKLAGEDVEISEKELKEAFIRDYGPRVKARMIMFDKLRIAQDVKDELDKNPDKFGALASKHSIDPASRALEGQIPPIPRYTGFENLEKCAFKLKMDEISGVIELEPNKFVILKCEGRTEPVVTSIDEVRDPLVDTLKESKTQAAVAKVFEKIKKETIVDNYLTQTTNRPDRPAGAGTGGGGNIQPTSGTKQKTSGTRSANSATDTDSPSRK